MARSRLWLIAPALGVMCMSGCRVDPDNLPEMTFTIPAEDAWAAPQLAPEPAAGEGRILVTNNLDDTVSVIDLDGALQGRADALLARVPVGFVPVEREGPHHIVADADGAFYFLGISNFVPGSGSGPHGVHGAGSADGHLMKMRVADNSLVASVRIQRNPGDVRLTPDGRLLLASHFDLLAITEAGDDATSDNPATHSSLAIIDPITMTRLALVPACPAAHGIGVTADSTRAVMSCMSDEVAIVDLIDEDHPVTRVPVLEAPGTVLQPTCFPYAITMDGDTAWTSCFNSGELIAIDARSGQRDGRVLQLQGLAMFGDVSDAGDDSDEGDVRVMAVAHQASGGTGVDGVTFLDPAGPTFLGVKLLFPDECVLPHVARFSEDQTQVLVVCEGDKASPGTLVVLDAAPPHDVSLVIPLGLFPDDLALLRRAP